MEEKRKIISSNKIPGCEKLTRPEEIQALSKYLGAIKKTQEEWIEDNIEDKPLEGIKNQAKFKEIDKLPQSRLELDTSKSDGRILKSIKKETLEEKVTTLPDSQQEKNPRTLPGKESRLNINPKEEKLKGERIGLKVPDPQLKGSVVGLNIPGEPKLPKDRENIYPKDLNELPKDRENIYPKDLNELPKERENIYPENLNELPKDRENIYPEEVLELSNSLIGLNVPGEPKLPKERENIYPENLNELPKDRENIYPEEPKDLPKGKEGLSITEPDSLPKDRLDISPLDVYLPDVLLGIDVPEVSQLPDTRLDISPSDPDELPTGNLGLLVTGPNDLPAGKERIIGSIPGVSLEDTRLRAPGDTDGPESLEDYILGLGITSPSELPEDRVPLTKIKTPKELPNSVLTITPDNIENLQAASIILPPDDSASEKEKSTGSIQLEDTKITLDSVNSQVSRSHGFSVEKDEGEVNKRISTRPARDSESPGADIKRIDNVIKSMGTNELYESIMSLLLEGSTGAEKGSRALESGNLELAGIISAYFGGDRNTGREAEAAGKILEILQKQKAIYGMKPEGDVYSLDDITSKREQNRYGASSMSPLQRGVEGPKTVDIDPNDEGYRKASVVRRVGYKLPGSNDNFLDVTSTPGALFDQDRYLRYLAEMAASAGEEAVNTTSVGSYNPNISSFARRAILEATLRALVYARNLAEDAAGIRRDRLPGKIGNYSSFIRSSGQEIFGKSIEDLGRKINQVLMRLGEMEYNKATGSTTGGRPLPLRRPKKDGESGIEMGNSSEVLSATYLGVSLSKKELQDLHKQAQDIKSRFDDLKENFHSDIFQTTVLQDIENKLEQNPILNSISKLSDLTGTPPSGIGLTLNDLCGKDFGSISTMEELQKALKESPYITTSGKLRSTAAKGERTHGSLTLDTNAYWEVVLEPLCEDDLNGGYSFLPSIGEINRENRVEHGINTGYSKWIPINNFELQKSKITSKSLGLFDGEINYPVSIEYTNELRLSVVDDQYKSWRRYFQRCADVSVYYSESHTKDFYDEIYDDGSSLESRPTAIDKTSFCTAFYQNITFRIKIYLMTPQYSTIKKFDLLCVLKDFSEEYVGDIDPSSTDLSLSFSIVGDMEGLGYKKPEFKTLARSTYGGEMGAIKSTTTATINEKAVLEASGFGPKKYQDGITLTEDLEITDISF